MELKRKKDELQLKAFDKLIDPLWSKYDTDGNGFITYGQCKQMMKQAFETGGYSEYFKEELVDKALA